MHPPNPVLALVLALPGGPLMLVAWAVLVVEGSFWAVGKYSKQRRTR